MFVTSLIIINLNANITILTKIREKIEIDQHNSRVNNLKTLKKILSFVNDDEI